MSATAIQPTTRRSVEVVLTCACGSEAVIPVTLIHAGCDASCTQPLPHDEPELGFTIPPTCTACGAALFTLDAYRDVWDTALRLLEGTPCH